MWLCVEQRHKYQSPKFRGVQNWGTRKKVPLEPLAPSLKLGVSLNTSLALSIPNLQRHVRSHVAVASFLNCSTTSVSNKNLCLSVTPISHPHCYLIGESFVKIRLEKVMWNIQVPILGLSIHTSSSKHRSRGGHKLIRKCETKLKVIFVSISLFKKVSVKYRITS